PREVLDEAEQVCEGRAAVDAQPDLARELAQLDVLEGELAPRIAVGEAGPAQRGKERVLLRRGPVAQALVKVGQREAVRGVVAAIERLAEVVEAGAEVRLRRVEQGPRGSGLAHQRPAIPGSMRS